MTRTWKARDQGLLALGGYPSAHRDVVRARVWRRLLHVSLFGIDLPPSLLTASPAWPVTARWGERASRSVTDGVWERKPPRRHVH